MDHIFNSLQEYYDFLTSPRSIERAKTRSHPNSASDRDEDFNQSKSLDEALDMLRNGTTDPRHDLAPNSPPTPLKHSTRTISVTAPVGYVPHVPNALINVPNSMITRQRIATNIKQRANSITIVRDVSYPGFIPAEEIRNLNLATTAYIRSLMMQNPQPRVTVYAHIGVNTNGNIQHVYVRVKAPDQRLIIPQLNFAFCHPSFLRRCFFRWEEVSYDMPYVSSGYGVPISSINDKLFPNTTVQFISSRNSIPEKK